MQPREGLTCTWLLLECKRFLSSSKTIMMCCLANEKKNCDAGWRFSQCFYTDKMNEQPKFISRLNCTLHSICISRVKFIVYFLISSNTIRVYALREDEKEKCNCWTLLQCCTRTFYWKSLLEYVTLHLNHILPLRRA